MRRECRERFPPPSTSKETACWRSRHASRHVRHARAVMHVGIANPRCAGKTFPALLAHVQPAILRIWQEAHGPLAFIAGPCCRQQGCVIEFAAEA